MTKEFQVLNLALDTIVGVATQLCPIDKLERHQLFGLLMFSNCPSAQSTDDVRLTFPKEPSPRVLTMRKSPSLVTPLVAPAG
jgi:hypothetical protein